jgi:hypothetical protein
MKIQSKDLLFPEIKTASDGLSKRKQEATKAS